MEDLSKYEKKGYLYQDFRVFYLTDTEPKEYENHYHEFDKITIFLRGKVNYVVEGKAYELEPYDMVLVGHHDIHKLYVDTSIPYERIIMYISPEFLRKYEKEDCVLDTCFQMAKSNHANVLRIGKLSESRMYQVMMDLKHTLDPHISHELYGKEFYKKLLFLEFMVHLNRACIGGKIQYVSTSQCNKKVVNIIDYINENLTEDLNIDDLAVHFYMSKYHMMRTFKEETGYSIGSYINNKRLLKAKDLVLGGMPITQVCFSCGFKDYSTFSRAYKTLFGESPRLSRLKHS